MPDDKRPPKKWWDKMVKEVSEGNPEYSDEQVQKTIGDIWYNELSESKRKEIRSQGTMSTKTPIRFSKRDKNTVKIADFMQEQVVQGDWIEVDGLAGTEWVEADVIDIGEVNELRRQTVEYGEVPLEGTLLGKFTENSIAHSIEIREGWWGARLSAPGYMDRTEWTVFKTEEEAREFLKEFYGEDEEEGLEEEASLKSKKAQEDSTEALLLEDLKDNIEILEDMVAVLQSFVEDVKDRKFEQAELENIEDALHIFFSRPVKINGDTATMLDELLSEASRKA